MRKIIVTCAATALLAAGVLSHAQTKGKAAPKMSPAPTYGNTDAISEDELKVYDFFLASDQLEGRNFPSRGYDTAALFVAAHLAEWGLKPFGSQGGTIGPLQPYLMPIELVAKTVVPEESKLTLTAPPAAGGRGFGGGGGGGQGRGNAANAEPRATNYEYGKEWTNGAAGGFGGGGGRGAGVEPVNASGNLVFAGNGYVINKTKINPYEGIDVKGKFIVVAGLPAELAAAQAGAGGRGGRQGGGRQGGRGAGNAGGDQPAAADAQPGDNAGGRGAGAQNPLGEACTDFLTPEQYEAKNGALGVITIANFQQLTALGNPNAGRGGRGNLNGPNYQVAKFRGNNSTCPSAPGITVGLELTNALFQGEKLNGSQVFYGAGANQKQDSFDLSTRKKLDLKVAVKSDTGHGENVVAMLEGGDPVLKNEYVVMSAHLDHIGLSQPLPNGHNVNNGADDDGSGTTGLMGIAHAYALGAAKGIRPKRSMIFLWVGGEEKGLLGSQ